MPASTERGGREEDKSLSLQPLLSLTPPQDYLKDRVLPLAVQELQREIEN